VSAAIRAEWTKLRTTSGPLLMLVAAAVVSRLHLGQVPVAVLGVLMISGEHSSGLILTTLVAIPNRLVVLAAKASVLSVAVAVVGLVGGAGSAVSLVLIALLSLGIGALVCDSAVAIGTVLGLLYLPPILTQLVGDAHRHRLLDRWSPMTAELAIKGFTGSRAGLGVLAVWSAGALIAGALRLYRPAAAPR
jgi:ABC-2 type transport system permease protein